MSQLAVSEGQPGNWEEPGLFLRRLETVRFQEEGWQEPCESRDSRTDLWERGGRLPCATRPSVAAKPEVWYQYLYPPSLQRFDGITTLWLD